MALICSRCGLSSPLATMSHRSASIQSGPPMIWKFCKLYALRMMLRNVLFVIVRRPPGCPRTPALSLPDRLRLIEATSNAGLAPAAAGACVGETPRPRGRSTEHDDQGGQEEAPFHTDYDKHRRKWFT